MRRHWIPSGEFFAGLLFWACIWGGIYWFKGCSSDASSPVDVEFCDTDCAAREAGYAFAQHRREAIDAGCSSRGEQFAAGCRDYWEEQARDDIPDDDPPDD